MQLTNRQRWILEEVANTFIAACEPPKGAEAGSPANSSFWEAKGSARVSAEKIAEIVSTQPRPAREEFSRLLAVLDSPLLGLTWGGPVNSFIDLTPEQKEKLFIAWSGSPVKSLRKAFASLKKLTTFIYFASSDDQGHPDFEALQYPGPLLGPAGVASRLPLLQPESDAILSCEILVIGTGAGGGVVAGELATAGKDVIVVDKGPYYEGSDFNQQEGKMVESLYDGKGAITSSNGQVSIFAGSSVGGGTTINWAGCFRTPDHILQEWAEEHDTAFFRQSSFQQSLDAVSDFSSVNTDFQAHNLQNKLLLDGSRRLNQNFQLIARNEKPSGENDFEKFGYSSLGDRYGVKQTTSRTFLKAAAERGARIIDNCGVEKLVIRGGRAVGAECSISKDGKKTKVFIQAEKIVVACGSIQTPALLQRSGLAHSHIGRHLHLHPTVAVSASYDQRSSPWHGPMMSVVNDHFSQATGNFGFKLETPPSHPGLIAMSLPWSGAQQFKKDMLGISRLATFIVLTRDKFGGYVTLDKDDQPIVHYQLNKFDLRHLHRGMEEASRIHFMQDCQQIIYPHYSNQRFENSGRRSDLEKFLHDLPVWGWKPNQFALYSAHQMGTCRMGGDKKTHPTSPDGSLYEVPNVYIADASAFPSASGVNPMLTVMALAHHTAQGMK